MKYLNQESQGTEKKMQGADLLVEMLVGYGVEHIFGVPGDTNVVFYGALEKRRREIHHVMARDERSAGFMADAYGRLTDKPGVFECPAGAGALYSVPPVAESNTSAIPVILLTMDIPLAGEGRGVLSELDCARLFEPISKMSELIKSADKIPEVLRRAFRAACTGTPGAVHLQIPQDILEEEVDPLEVSLHVEEECMTFPAFRTGTSNEKIDALLSELDRAERPLIVAGGGLVRSHAQQSLKALAERANVPVVTTMTGQGSIPADHRLGIGVIGDNGFHPHANLALEEADLVLFIGSKLGSVVTVGFTLPQLTLDKRISHIDIDPVALGNSYENVLAIAGDARMVLDQLLERMPETLDNGGHTPWVDHLNGYRSEFWNNAAQLLEGTDTPLLPERVAHELNAVFATGDLRVNVLSDAGTPTPYMTRFLQTNEDVRLIIPRAYGGLGYAIPAVVGAWYADPDRRPVGLFGDGSLGMSAGELETLTRLRVPAILILFNNATFGWIRGLHKLRGTREPISVDFSPPDGKAIGEAFGLRSWRVTSPAELKTALAAAIEHDGPCLLDVVVESIADRVPPVYSWLTERSRDPLSLVPENVPYF